MRSRTSSIYDVVGAFLATEDPQFLGPNRVWNATNPQQEDFLPLLEEIRVFAPVLMKEGLLEAKVSWLAADINTWFASRGFDIELTDQNSPEVFYAGSIYEQLIKWAIEGEQKQIRGQDGQMYPGVAMEDKGVSIYTCNGEFPVAKVGTKNPRDTAYFSPVTPSHEDHPFALLMQAKMIQENLKASWDFKGIQFPMVHVDIKNDVTWLVDFWTRRDAGQLAWIVEAKQQSILKINHLGALAKSAFGMAVALEMCVTPAVPLVIDEPFLFWIHREGYPLPLFAAHVDYEDWKNPGELK